MVTTIIGRAVRSPLTSESTINQESKMHSLLTAVLCLSMAVCILANDFELGERKMGDHSIIDRTINIPPNRWNPMPTIATVGMTCPSDNEIITYVKIHNINGNEVDYYLYGDVGTKSLAVRITGKRNERLSLKVEGYCIDPNTSEVPITTE
ncbi:uncharacterized protein LOC105184897 [Harpegnathos saltator]|uniref:uncharacterized protein LOC105184897 n=1 Tax=Harpegnathos saltator TaxID=610380 RepID=UPI000DBED629|nr:uncharacterized protein LOC105184897 [Harpegnathos saltator]